MNEFSIHYAAGKGDLCRVRQLIEAGISVNCRNEEELLYKGDTPLHRAARCEQYEMVGLLINSKCDLDIKGPYGKTPVMVAAYFGYRDIVHLLLHRGAQVNYVDDDGCTLLHHASSSGCTGTVRVILDHGEADLNAADGEGWTPLMVAVIHEHKEIAALLIRAGANINVKNYQGSTALSEGISYITLTHEEIRLFVQNGAFIENCDDDLDFYKENVLKDVELCTQSVVNKFNCQSLPALNSITYFARRLPNVDNFKLGARAIEEVENLVKCDIERNTFCNVVKVHPISLSSLCVLSLITCQSGKKRAASPDFGHSPFKKIHN